MKTREEKQKLLDKLIKEYDVKWYAVTESWKNLVCHEDTEANMRVKVLERKVEEDVWKPLSDGSNGPVREVGQTEDQILTEFVEQVTGGEGHGVAYRPCPSEHKPLTPEEEASQFEEVEREKREFEAKERQRIKDNGGRVEAKDLAEFTLNASRT